MADKEKLTIVLFSGELDRALAAFMLATTGASMGMEVNMFFTFWGLNVIKKNEGRIESKGIARKMLNLLNRGGSRRLKLSRFHMFGMGTWMMKRLMKDVRMPSVDEFIGMAHAMGVKLFACNTSCGVMGLPENAFREEVEGVAGAAYFLGEARQSKVSLFI
ncbi:MAG: DsrE/DsrF/DrsH-like family protein [Dehalococcoidia bacterium]|nr:DsrE/DsrF/DrsH-like family protein [Dehalococcoidia bacterium]